MHDICDTLYSLSYLVFSRVSSRCLWDADTDNYAEDVFMNVSAFALVTHITCVRQQYLFIYLLWIVLYLCRTACFARWQFSEAITTEDNRLDEFFQMKGSEYPNETAHQNFTSTVHWMNVYNLFMQLLHVEINTDDIQCRSDGYPCWYCSLFF